MFSTQFFVRLVVAMAMFQFDSAQITHNGPRRHSRRKSTAVAAAEWNKADAGTPLAQFQASSSIPVAEIAAAAKKSSKTAATYPVNDSKSAKKSVIHSDWAAFKDGAAYSFIADMDVDCDGIDSKCKGNPDGQGQTDYGALAAYEVPWIVIPESFVNKNSKAIPGNNLAAVICNGKMFYGIFGDSNGDSPQVIGEASWRMATACFPDGKISGANGHAPVDVTYIVFTGADAVLPKTALSKNYITDFSVLKTMGDKFTTALAKNLKLSVSGSNSTDTSTETSTGTKTSTKTSTSTKTTASTKASGKTSSNISSGSGSGSCDA